ncbi:MAG: type II secretion system major pseudopilin GspG [Novosphingobium sp.]
MTDLTVTETARADAPETAAARPDDRRRRNGFSLVELMVVIFIIGLLATVVLINVLPSQDKAMVVKARGDIATLEQAMEMYRLDMATYPGQAEGLSALKTPPANLAMPQNYRSGGYVKDIPADPWGRPYQYQVPGRDGRPFEIFSLGADGQPGGTDLNADIYASAPSGQN